MRNFSANTIGEEIMEKVKAVKADLTIVLKANKEIVAESHDVALWNTIFTAIATGGTEIHGKTDSNKPDSEKQGSETKNGPLASFARELNVTSDELIGACAPRTSSPLISLDDTYWEKLRGFTGARGKNAIAPISLTVTLLALWEKHRPDSSVATTREARSTLNTIHLVDKNPSRSLKNCEWLQPRGGGWVINPAMRSKAVKLARAYVKQESPIGSEK